MIHRATLNNRKLILYISCTLDGYIAKPNDDLSFLNLVQKEGEDYGYYNFVANVDTIIVGRKTYQWIVDQGFEFPHKDKDCYIITRQDIPNDGNLTFYNGSLKELVHRLKAETGKHIYCDGGAEVVNILLRERLLDEMIVSVIPTVVGTGTKLFQEQIPEEELTLFSSKGYSTGLVQLHYAFKR